MTTYTTTALSKLFEHRYKFIAHVYHIRTKEFVENTVFLDTGCFNTMIPRKLAKLTGHPLGFSMKYSLGGSLFEADAYSIDKIMIADFVMERVVAFAGDYRGGYEDDIILGTNVINNWEMIISRKNHSLQFREDPLDSLPNKVSIYQNYFDKAGNYICAQDNEPRIYKIR